ncbi:MAG: DUF2336 domain-containing protein, partial [Pseudomonadota bacterium]
LDMLLMIDEEDRIYTAERLRKASEAPKRLLLYLAICDFKVAKPLLEDNEGFDSSDLSDIAGRTGLAHRTQIAMRRSVPPSVGDALVASGEVPVIKRLLENEGAELSEATLDQIVAVSRDAEELCLPLLGRREVRAAQAMTLFWWADSQSRRVILQRHAADRSALIDRCSDVFPMASEENWSDPVVRKTLQLIERRQRNRLAIPKSPFDSLEEAVEAAAKNGLSAEVAQEIGYLSGVKPVTIAKIFDDRGGEGLAVLCKATGLKREYLALLWRALRRDLTDENGKPDQLFQSLSETFESLPVGRAQTTLRYWNWSLSSAFSPKQLAKVDPANDENQFSSARQTARLVFGA